MLLSTRLDQFMEIIAVFDAALLGFTTVRISSEPFNAPLYRSWSSFWRIRHSWRGSTLGLDQFLTIIAVFDGVDARPYTPSTRYRAVFGARTHSAARHTLGTLGLTPLTIRLYTPYTRY